MMNVAVPRFWRVLSHANPVSSYKRVSRRCRAITRFSPDCCWDRIKGYSKTGPVLTTAK